MLVEFVVVDRYDPEHIGAGRRGDLERGIAIRVG
jgi:hypothetical protein